MITENDQHYILALMQRSLGLDAALPVPEDLQAIKRVVCRNDILSTVYHEMCPELKEMLKRDYGVELKQSLVQDAEGKRVLQALSMAGADCIALKGWELRKLYPDRTMRHMVDMDILVRDYDFGSLKKIMEGLGYASAGHELAWMHDSFEKNEVHFELHKRLTDDSQAIMQWEKGIWDRAVPTDLPHVFRMTEEDSYIYHFIHLYRDFVRGSLGLRRVMDTWLLQGRPVDAQKVCGFFRETGLLKFHERMVHFGKVCMGKEMADEQDAVLLMHACVNGIFGTPKSYKNGRVAAMADSESLRSGKIRSGIRTVFPPLERMKAQFPVLQKWPVLLLFCWLRRILHFAGQFGRSRDSLDYSLVTESSYDEMRRFFEAGGIEQARYI